MAGGYTALPLIHKCDPKKTYATQIGIFFKQNPGEAHLTAEDLQQMVANNNTCFHI